MQEKVPDKSAITGLVLSGGQGRRMGGVDKGLLLFEGRPLFMHALERLRPQVGPVVVNANANLAAYAEGGFPVVSDEPLSFAGPLAGFAAGLRFCRTPFMVTVPCDSPFFPADLVFRLSEALVMEDADLAVAMIRDGEILKPQPVFCLMKCALLANLEAYLGSGQRKIDRWYASLKVAFACFPDSSAFDNMNTIAELRQIQDGK